MASTPAAETASQTARAAFDAAHARLLADANIQFSLDPYRPDPPPAWLRWLIDFLVQSWPVLRIFLWIAIAALALFLLYHLGKRLAGESWPWPRAKPVVEEEALWQPEEAPARALLAEADKLAAAGRFADAAHVLLFRSIETIQARRPKLVRPALTSRDIAGAPDLPDRPKNAFATIVHHVELSLFGGKLLAEPDWRQCRAAYEEFAFAKAWKG